jgi:hypothetical protein
MQEYIYALWLYGCEKNWYLFNLLNPALIRHPVEGGLFRLSNVTMDFFCYLLLFKLLHGSVVRPSSGRNIFAKIYSTDNGSVFLKLFFSSPFVILSNASSKISLSEKYVHVHTQYEYMQRFVCRVLFERCVILGYVLCFIVVPLALGKFSFVVQLNNNSKC